MTYKTKKFLFRKKPEHLWKMMRDEFIQDTKNTIRDEEPSYATRSGAGHLDVHFVAIAQLDTNRDHFFEKYLCDIRVAIDYTRPYDIRHFVEPDKYAKSMLRLRCLDILPKEYKKEVLEKKIEIFTPCIRLRDKLNDIGITCGGILYYDIWNDVDITAYVNSLK